MQNKPARKPRADNVTTKGLTVAEDQMPQRVLLAVGSSENTSASQPKPIKIRLGDYKSDVEAFSEQFNMPLATFCSYCVKYFLENFEGKSLPPLKGAQQRNLDV